MSKINYLTAHRKRWALSQEDLGALLDMSGTALCRFETGARDPDLCLALSFEVIFGLPARTLFPDLYARIEALVIDRAAKFSIPLEKRSSAKSKVKRELLAMINARACGIDIVA